MDPIEIRTVLENYNEPLIFKGIIDWDILKWTLDDWEHNLKDTDLQFRKNDFKKSNKPIWESSCEQVKMTMREFILFPTDKCDSCVYFDYKHMSEWFRNHTNILQDVSWKQFGYPEKSGVDSTIWIGSQGAHTPCHKDTYGFNLIAQIYGRKEWLLFPPEENLLPTRIPYEESSVYSKLNLFTPNLEKLKGINNCRSVILNPGDVLFLPPNWWHYVENLEKAISINIWLPIPQDDVKRVEEAIVQLLISQVSKSLSEERKREVLNPNHVDICDLPLSTTMDQLQQSLNSVQTAKTKLNKKIKHDNEFKANIFSDINLEILKSSSIIKVSKLSQVEFKKHMENKIHKFEHLESEPDAFEEDKLINKFINSICHPDTINVITQKLFIED